MKAKLRVDTRAKAVELILSDHSLLTDNVAEGSDLLVRRQVLVVSLLQKLKHFLAFS